MNRVMLIGRLTATPELRYTSSNIACCNFTIAVNRQGTNKSVERQADFINIVAWRKLAENLVNYQQRGNQIAVEGRLQSDKYTDKDGKNRISYSVQADTIHFLESKGKKETIVPEAENQEIENDPFKDFGNMVDNEYLD